MITARILVCGYLRDTGSGADLESEEGTADWRGDRGAGPRGEEHARSPPVSRTGGHRLHTQPRAAGSAAAGQRGSSLSPLPSPLVFTS